MLFKHVSNDFASLFDPTPANRFDLSLTHNSNLISGRINFHKLIYVARKMHSHWEFGAAIDVDAKHGKMQE